MIYKNVKLFAVIWFCIGLTELNAQTIQDIDGNVYSIITIGKQEWIRENLKTTRYSNGDSIGTTTPATLDITNEPTLKYQWAYEGNENNIPVYGRLYTWFAAIDDRNICPADWRVPTSSDWSTLIIYLVGESVAGGKLKETGITHWKSPNTGATNASGFTALPGGYRYGNGTFYDIGGTCNWWSSTDVSANNAWCYTIYNNLKNVNKHNGKKTNGLSLRCVRDL